MSVGLLLPALIVVVVASLSGIARWPLRPTVAIRVLSVIAAVSSAIVLFMAIVGVVGFFARSAVVLSLIAWCPLVPLHHEIALFEGVVSVVVVVASMFRIRRVLSMRRGASSGTEGRRLAVLDTSEPIAYAAPGTPGCVVVSQGMLDVLGPRERQVLFAHERAHLDQKHHRYLLVAELAVAVLPTLRPLAGQLRLATERCADEAAANAMGDDRQLVARSIAKAAVRADDYRNLVGSFGGGSVRMRVQALLSPEPSPASLQAGSLTTFAIAAIAVVATGVQVHHVAELINHLCHG